MNSREIRIKIKSLSIQKLFDLDSYFSEVQSAICLKLSLHAQQTESLSENMINTKGSWASGFYNTCLLEIIH